MHEPLLTASTPTELSRAGPPNPLVTGPPMAGSPMSGSPPRSPLAGPPTNARRRNAPRPNTPPPSRRPGYLAGAWVLAFVAMHVYWFAGGRVGFGDQADPIPDASFGLFGLAVAVSFALGAVVPFAAVRPWGSRLPRWMLVTALGIGCALLTLRGLAGLADDLLRVTGIADNGLTGLTWEQTLGSAHPSARTLWSGRAIDAYFTLGGLLFGLAARSCRAASREQRPQ